MYPLQPYNLAHLSVVLGIPVADPPNPKNKIDLLALPNIKQVSTPIVPSDQYVRPLLLFTEDLGAIALMDKPHPHALFDIMAIQAGTQIHSSLSDLTDQERYTLIRLIYLFSQFIKQKDIIEKFNLYGYLPRISFNFDPWTQDRPGLQPVTRLHVHMYLISKDVLQTIRLQKQPFSSIESSFVRQRMVDPVSFLAPHLLYDIHQHFVSLPSGMNILPPDAEKTIREGMPLGLNILLQDGWETLANDQFITYLNELHKCMEERSFDVFEAFTGKRSIASLGSRNKLFKPKCIEDNIDNLTWLSQISKKGLKQLAVKLRDVEQRLVLADTRHKHWSVLHVVSNGLAYSLGLMPTVPICHNDDNITLMLNINIRLFGEVGGAGLFGCEGISSIMLDRGKGVLTDTELKHRWEFQRLFQQMVQRMFSLHTLVTF